jgi:hypothetical protein
MAPQPGSVVADAFDPHHLEMSEALCPGQEVAVSDAGGGHGVAAQGSTELIGCVRDMKVFVGVDPDGDTCGRLAVAVDVIAALAMYGFGRVIAVPSGWGRYC